MFQPPGALSLSGSKGKVYPALKRCGSKWPVFKRAEIICHSRQHFVAAFIAIRRSSLEVEPIVRTAPDAAGYAGALYLRSAVEFAQQSPGEIDQVVLDCGDNPSLVLGALRVGWLKFAFSGTRAVRAKLSQIIVKSGGGIVQINQGPVIDLNLTSHPIKCCQTWLKGVYHNSDGD